MTIAEVIRAKLLANAPLSALVGTRVYPAKLPQNPTYPAIVYSRISGGYQSDIAFGSPVFQFDCWADGYLAAENLCSALRGALEREKFVSSGFEITQCSMANTPIDLYDDEVQKYRVSVDFKINYREV